MRTAARQFNPSATGNTRFSPLENAAGVVIPTIYAGTTLDCALMETVFHDVPFAAGPKIWSKASHVAGKVYSQLMLSRDLALINLSAIALHKLGIPRKDLIESDGSQYPRDSRLGLGATRSTSGCRRSHLDFSLGRS